MKNKKGFTLVEILAVIVLISLIVIIAIPSVKSISAKSKRKLFDTKVKIAEEALNMWAEANSSCFEEESDGCGILDGCTIDANGNTKCTVTFEKLASNGIIDYDLEEGDNKYVVDPTINQSMNKYIIDVVYDNNTKLVTSSFDESDENKKVAEKIITTKKGETTVSTSNAIADEITASTTTTTTTHAIKCNSFSSDDWRTIKYNIDNNNSSCYKVGDKKQVFLSGYGYYYVRLVNTSKPSSCSNSEFSQTACGFVFDFEESIIVDYANDSESNLGGWESSKMRNVVNTTIYNVLPDDLKELIVKTKVVSGHEENITNNYVTYDYLFLPSLSEIYANANDDMDSAASNTRQLDYYRAESFNGILGAVQITSDSVFEDDSITNNPHKYYLTSYKEYWLRTPGLYNTFGYSFIDMYGNLDELPADITMGLSPAFKIN